MKPVILPGNLDSLEALRRYITAAAEVAELDKKATYRLCLAVDEIATNAVIHGYQETGLQGNLKVWANLDDRSLKVYLEDEGPPFDPTQIPPPNDLDLPPDQRRIGGLGVYLTLKGVSQLIYERIGERNRNIFMVNRGEPPHG
jgi:anti-sigma regulatory factor (Ser/Thr protein kinase)